jgi:arylformamidase
MSEPIFLSHWLNSKTEGFGGTKSFEAKFVRSKKNGDSSNQQNWNLSNHVGTHIDTPFHFDDNGKTLDQFSANDWIFKKPYLLDLETPQGSIIEPGTWCEVIPQNADLVLLKTGFERYRGSETYWAKNPGLSPELASWLRAERPSLRCLGFDFISITSFENRELGRKAHMAFLSPDFPGTPIMAIEDMHLKNLICSPTRVTVMPMMVEGADGSPVTIIAEFI